MEEVGRKRTLWPLISLVPFGCWAPVIAGVRCGVPLWTGLGLLWAVVLGVALSSPHALGGLLLIAWLGGGLTSFSIRYSYSELMQRHPPPAPAWPAPTQLARTLTVRYSIAAIVAGFVLGFVVGELLHLAGVRFSFGASAALLDAALLVTLVPLWRRGLRARDLGFREVPGAQALGYGALALLVYFVAAVGWDALVPQPHSADPFRGVAAHGAFTIGLSFVQAAVVAPAVEEILFRGLLYRALRNRLGVTAAVLIAGFIFGGLHVTGYPLVALPEKMLFGVLMCLLYERTGSLLPCIAVHAFVDGLGIEHALGVGWITTVIYGSLVVVLLARGTLARRDVRFAAAS